MSKNISNQEMAKYLLQRLSPYSQNVLLNVSRETQKKIIEEIGLRQNLREGLFSGIFDVLHLDGSELMKETAVLKAAIEDWCIQKGFGYDDIEREYRKLQEANIDRMSADKLREFQKELWNLERKRSKNLQSRAIAHILYRSYLGCKLYEQLLSTNPNALTSIETYLPLSDENKDKIAKQYEAILSGNMEGYLSNSGFDIFNLQKACARLFETERHGFLTLVRNGESIVDYDLHTVINGIMAARSASLSVSLMSRANQMYSYYVNDGFHLEETHDIRTQDVKTIKKYWSN